MPEPVMSWVTDGPAVPIKSDYNRENKCPKVVWWKPRKRHAWKIIPGKIQGGEILQFRVWRYECIHCGQWIERPGLTGMKRSGCLYYDPVFGREVKD